MSKYPIRNVNWRTDDTRWLWSEKYQEWIRYTAENCPSPMQRKLSGGLKTLEEIDVPWPPI